MFEGSGSPVDLKSHFPWRTLVTVVLALLTQFILETNPITLHLRMKLFSLFIDNPVVIRSMIKSNHLPITDVRIAELGSLG
jgi:hypothetical protein